MSTKDILKKSIVESFSVETSKVDFAILMIITFLICLYIFFLYRYVRRDTFYSNDFNITLVVMGLVTGAIVYAMQSNLIISLGMVGALSIVRFRNAVKDSLDLLFLFWSISIGIIGGAGLFQVAVQLSVMVTIAVLLLKMVPNPKTAMLLVINSNEIDSADKIEAVIKENTKKNLVKSKNLTQKGVDMIVEFRGAKENELLQKVMEIDGVTNVALLNHNGERRF